MKLVRREIRYIFSVFVVMTMMTFFTNMDLDIGLKTSRTLQSYAAAPVNPAVVSGRAPASVEEVNQQSIDKDFFCSESKVVSRDKTTKSLVMINLNLCLDGDLIESVALQNLTNGFVAQIFKMGENKFKTDYIQLSEGLNKLNFEVILKDGQKHQESLEILSGS